MANLVLTFAEVLAGAVILDAGIKGDSIANVVQGKATQHPLPGSSSGNAPGASGSVAPGTYINPVPGGRTGRIDQGVDYTLGSQGFLAPGNSKILQADATNHGWGGGGYIAGQLLDGPLAGTVWYAAEGIAPQVHAGDTVNAGQVIGTPVTNPFNGALGNIEAGWANATGNTPLAQSQPGYSGDQSIQGLTEGWSFSRFVQALGGPAGVFQGAGQALASTVEGLFGSGLHPAGAPY